MRILLAALFLFTAMPATFAIAQTDTRSEAPSPEDALRRYVASGEPRDKAGAYGVQGLASGFVTRLEGSYTNVVGLPAAESLSLLLEHGALGQWP